jgi:thiol-disulfide isomerase/thioredoxin
VSGNFEADTTPHEMRMKKTSRNFVRQFVCNGIFFLLVADNLFAQTTTNSTASMPVDYVKTNGEYVTIGRIMVKTNSPMNTEEFKQYHWRCDQVFKLMNSDATNATDLVAEGARALIKDYPDRPNGYQLIMSSIEDYEYLGQPDKARALADELVASSAPEKYKLWTKGFLNRVDSYDKPVVMQFTAVDGREVDLASMKGKVVLVDYWATTCVPCVAELPRVKAAYDKFHAQGFEVIGISCDTDKDALNKFLKEKGFSWPQYFDGKNQESNKFAQGFGIDGIPHMFLVDKKGLLSFDNVRASDSVHQKDDTTSFEEKISKLLAED